MDASLPVAVIGNDAIKVLKSRDHHETLRLGSPCGVVGEVVRHRGDLAGIIVIGQSRAPGGVGFRSGTVHVGNRAGQADGFFPVP